MNLSEIENITGEKSKIDKRTFTVVPYSPVFIGSGIDKRKGLDFYCRGGKTYFFNLKKIYEYYLQDIDSLEHSLLKGNLDQFIKGKGEKPENFIQQSVNGDVLGQELMQPTTDGFGNPIIPGSSLKGSIRTALFAQLFSDKKMSSNEYSRLIKGRNVSAKAIENLLLSTREGGKAPNYDLGRVLRISDSTFKKEDLEVFNSVVINETNDGFQYKVMGRGSRNSPQLTDATFISKLALSFDADLVKPANVTMTIDQGTLKSIGWKQSFNFQFIANCCNLLSKRLIKYEQDYIEVAIQDRKELIPLKNEYEYLLEDVNQCIEDTQNGKICWIQRLGWGSGWLGMTGAHALLKDPRGNEYIDSLRKATPRMFRKTGDFEYPKTRKIVLDFDKNPSSTMGWVLVEAK